MRSKVLTATCLVLAIFSLSISSCKKKTTYANADFMGTYVGTYNTGTGTASKAYSFEFTNDTDMNVYDGTVGTGNKANGKYTKSGTTITGYYVYTVSPLDTVRINASLPNATTYVLTGTWTKGASTGGFTVTKQ
jgi:hypothetical protein